MCDSEQLLVFLPSSFSTTQTLRLPLYPKNAAKRCKMLTHCQQLVARRRKGDMWPAKHLDYWTNTYGVLSESQRREVHELFMLPLNRPLLRRSNRYIFPSDPTTDGYLTNPHVGLTATASMSCHHLVTLCRLVLSDPWQQPRYHISISLNLRRPISCC